MKLLAIDLETFYDAKTYSLRGMTTEEYINDPRFRAELLSFSEIVNGKVIDRGVLRPRGIAGWVAAQDWSDTWLINQNAFFDSSILAWKYGARPARISCTLSMARAMGFGTQGGVSLANIVRVLRARGYNMRDKGTEVDNASGMHYEDMGPDQQRRYRDYCQDDSYNAATAFLALIEEGFPASELVPLSESLRCYTEPRLHLNTEKLAEIVAEKARRQGLVLGSVFPGLSLTASLELLRSDGKFARVLQELGVDPPTKVNAKGEIKYAFAKTDEGMQILLQHPDEMVVEMVEARLENKSTITASRSQRLLDISKRSAWPVMLNFCAAHTTRFGGGDKTNPQNLGKKDGMRDAVDAGEGNLLVVVDQSQIEARVNAYVSQQEDLLDIFRKKGDPYCDFGNRSKVFEKEVTKATVDERFVAKGIVLGGGFGSSAAAMERQIRNMAFSLGLDVNLNQDYEALNISYRRLNSRIVNNWYVTQDNLEKLQRGESSTWGKNDLLKFVAGIGFALPGGLYIRYPNLEWEEIDDPFNEGKKKLELHYDYPKGRGVVRARIWGSKCVENYVQGISAVLIREKWAAIVKRVKRELGFKYGPVVLQCHDELVMRCKAAVAEDLAALSLEEMRKPPVWMPDIPLDAEVGIGYRYSDAK